MMRAERAGRRQEYGAQRADRLDWVHDSRPQSGMHGAVSTKKQGAPLLR